jgi:hypothetical protein
VRHVVPNIAMAMSVLSVAAVLVTMVLTVAMPAVPMAPVLAVAIASPRNVMPALASALSVPTRSLTMLAAPPLLSISKVRSHRIG